jgi:hypothetical protein
LPRDSILSIHLSCWLEALRLGKKSCSQDNLVSHHFLVVIWVRGAIGAIIAVDSVARISFVGVLLQSVAALSKLDGVLRNDLIEGKFGARERFACVAMATRQS